MREILKISIFGMPGSGKTTLAKELGITLNLPVIHLDKLLWDKGWVLRSKQNFLDDQQKIIQLDKWIIEGASISSLSTRYEYSDFVVYLKPSRFLCLFRVIARVVRNWLNGCQPEDKPDGCHERITFDFLRYLWGFGKTAEIKINALLCAYPNTQLITIEHRNDYLRMMDQLMVSIKLP